MELVDFDLLDDDAPSAVAVADPPSNLEMVSVGFSMTAEEDWRRLRNYVVEKIEATTGPFPRNPVTEKAIFRGFMSRWGDKSMDIAKIAFETYGGYWHNAPIRVNRFTKNNDPFFASVIAASL